MTLCKLENKIQYGGYLWELGKEMIRWGCKGSEFCQYFFLEFDGLSPGAFYLWQIIDLYALYTFLYVSFKK